MFVYMYVHALTPPACGLSFICNKVLFCSVLLFGGGFSNSENIASGFQPMMG